DRILLIPGVKKLGLLAGEVQLVTIAHIEVGTRNAAAGANGRLGEFLFEVDFHCALAILAVAPVPLAVHKVGTVAVDFAHRGLQVMHITFYLAINRVFGAVFTSAVLPALTLMTK